MFQLHPGSVALKPFVLIVLSVRACVSAQQWFAHYLTLSVDAVPCYVASIEPHEIRAERVKANNDDLNHWCLGEEVFI